MTDPIDLNERAPRSAFHRLLRAAVLLMLVAALVIVAALVWLRLELNRPHAGWSGEVARVEIEPGLDAGSAFARLAEGGVIRNARVLRWYLLWSGEQRAIQAGEYRFSEPATPLEVLERLQRGDVVLYQVTLPEGLVLEEIAARIAEQGLADEASLLVAFRDPSLVAGYDDHAENLEGYLFPETYSFPRSVTAEQVAVAMVERFREMVGSDYSSRARAVGLDLRRAVTLATLIEKETSVPDERQRISAVFHNRLKRGMRLQCDPTVIYAHLRAGSPVRNLRSRHLKIDSPYNTYRYGGLPPGPIANPGRESLEAAVRPIETREFYFVAAPGGGHRFSETLAAHEAAVSDWRRYVRSSR